MSDGAESSSEQAFRAEGGSHAPLRRSGGFRGPLPEAEDATPPRVAGFDRPLADRHDERRPVAAARGQPFAASLPQPPATALQDRRRAADRRVDRRVVRPGAAGTLHAGPGSGRYPRQRAARGLRRAAGAPVRDQHGLCRRRAPDADHPARGQPRRPADRQPVADGRRPPGRRFAHQRGDSAAGAERAHAFHSPLRPQPAGHRAVAGPRLDLPGDGGRARGGHRGADQHHDQRRHRFRQDHDAQCPLAVHSRPTSGW